MTQHADIFITNIEKDTTQNKFYRKVVYTTDRQQIVLMSIKPKEDVEFEIHPENDQFIRIEKGSGVLYVGPKKESKYELTDGVATIIPAGTWHQIVNTSSTDDLKLYTLYSPPHHPRDEVQINRPVQCHNEQAGGSCGDEDCDKPCNTNCKSSKMVRMNGGSCGDENCDKPCNTNCKSCGMPRMNGGLCGSCGMMGGSCGIPQMNGGSCGDEDCDKPCNTNTNCKSCGMPRMKGGSCGSCGMNGGSHRRSYLKYTRGNFMY